jgi:hypothetical protein
MKMISNIVFTKNRPLQLEAYLQSLYRYFPLELIQTYILYKVELFDKEYGQVFANYPDSIVMEEGEFFTDFVKLLDQVGTEYVLFGVDDVVYFDSVDFAVIEECFERFSEDIFGFSLRFGYDRLKDGRDPLAETAVAGQTTHRIDWTQGQTPNTRYPFELCATVYRTALVKEVLSNAMNNNPLVRRLFSPSNTLIRGLRKVISTRRILKSFGYFYSPNTLESWTCRWCQNHSSQLPRFLYFQKQCAAAIQVNMVNTSTGGEAHGESDLSVEELNRRYKQGFRVDIDFVRQNRPKETHCGREYFRVRPVSSGVKSRNVECV